MDYNNTGGEAAAVASFFRGMFFVVTAVSMLSTTVMASETMKCTILKANLTERHATSQDVDLLIEVPQAKEGFVDLAGRI